MEELKIILLSMLISYVVFCIIFDIRNIIKQRKPKKPKNIKHIGGNYLRGNCPKCGFSVSNCDGQLLGGISYCSCCGTKILFPKNQPKIEGIKSVSIDEYEKSVRK